MPLVVCPVTWFQGVTGEARLCAGHGPNVDGHLFSRAFLLFQDGGHSCEGQLWEQPRKRTVKLSDMT